MRATVNLIQAAKHLSVNWRTVAKWIRQGKLKATGEGKHDHITLPELVQFATEYDLVIKGHVCTNDGEE